MAIQNTKCKSKQWLSRAAIAALGLSLLLATVLLLSLTGTTSALAEDPPRMDVIYTFDWVGVRAGPSQDVTVVVKDKATVSGSTDGDGEFQSHHYSWTPSHPQIGPGDTVTGTVGGTLMVIDPGGKITAEADYEADTVSGKIDAPWFGSQTLTARCEVWGDDGPEGIEIDDVNADGGSFICDFGEAGWDLQNDRRIAVRYIQPDGHRVATVIEPPKIQIDYDHDWVQVDNQPAVSVRVDLNDTAYVEGTTDEDGRFISFDWSWTPERPDIVPGDIVSVTVGGKIVGVVKVGDIESKLDFEADIVSGMISAPWLGSDLVSVRCEIWEESSPDGIEIADVSPDDGSFSCDFTTRSWDLQPNQLVAVRYRQSDGNEVISHPEAPWVRVNYGHNWVGANYEAGHTFVVTVTDSADSVRAIAEIESEAQGGWGGSGFETRGEDWTPDHPDIQAGDLVHFSADDGYDKVMRVGEISGTIDVANDSISGPIYADWIDDTLDVECHAWGAWPEHVDDRRSTAEPDGTVPYSCDWSGEWDVQPGRQIAVFYAMPGVRDLVGNVFQKEATRYVAKTGSDDDDNQCLDPAEPCKTIEHARHRSENGDEIWIAEGTYLERISVHDFDFSLHGGYTISGTQWLPDSGETIMDGNQDGRVLRLEHCNVTIENLSITGGRDNGNGAGIVAYDESKVMLKNVKVYANTSVEDKGGGIAVFDDSTVSIYDSKIYANVAEDGEGGGIVVAGGTVHLVRSWVAANAALNNEGGGIAAHHSLLHIENSVVAGNQSATNGGGLWVLGGSPAAIVNSHIVGNKAVNDGAAIATTDDAHIVMTNTLVIGNTGKTGIDDRDETGSIFELNYCDTYGNSPDGTDGVTITRTDCLGSSASGGLDPQMAGGSLPSGIGPDFAEAWMAYDYRPLPGSPVIDAGSNDDAPADDIDGASRPQDGDLDGTPVTDMGAYELGSSHLYLPMIGSSQ